MRVMLLDLPEFVAGLVNARNGTLTAAGGGTLTAA